MGTLCGYSCSIPKNVVLTEVDYGVFRAVVTVDTGPFGSLIAGTREFTLRK